MTLDPKIKKNSIQKRIESALNDGRQTLSEYESKHILAAYHIPVTREILVHHQQQLPAAAATVGYPMVMKGCGTVAHKTELNLVHLDIRCLAEAQHAYADIMSAMPDGGAVLVQEMITGRREIAIGMTRDPQFGVCVMFGLGGIFTEILKDITFRKAPLETQDARAMLHDIRGHAILSAFRGMPAANTNRLAEILIEIGTIGLDFDCIHEIDLNPVILSGPDPVVADALIVLKRP